MAAMVVNVFGHRLHTAMVNKGMSVSALAQALYSSATSIYHYLEGKAMPPMYKLARLAEILGVSLDWLIGINLPIQQTVPAAPVAHTPQTNRPQLHARYRQTAQAPQTAEASVSPLHRGKPPRLAMDRANKIVAYYNDLQPGTEFSMDSLCQATGLTRAQVYSSGRSLMAISQLLNGTRVSQGVYRKPAV